MIVAALQMLGFGVQAQGTVLKSGVRARGQWRGEARGAVRIALQNRNFTLEQIIFWIFWFGATCTLEARFGLGQLTQGHL